MRLLVCGDRNWSDYLTLSRVLDSYRDRYGLSLVIIEGTAPGADDQAGRWARSRGLHTQGRLLEFPAHWRHGPDCASDCREMTGRPAGAIRNRRQYKLGMPDEVVAFHHDLAQSKGTLDMVDVATRGGTPTLWVRGSVDVDRQIVLDRGQVSAWVKAKKARPKP